MATQDPKLRNRAQRRAAEREKSSKTSSSSHLDQTDAPYELAQPDRSGPKGKTLFEIAAERQAELEKEGFYERNPPPKKAKGEGSYSEFLSDDEDDEPIGPVGEAFVWGISLAMLHFTFDVMVFHQYRQTIEWGTIFAKTGKMLPALFLVIYALHSKFAQRFPVIKQWFFLACSIAAGCYLIKSGNNNGYYAVMKTAPPIGTLWIWSVVEMHLEYALAHVVVMLGYVWWNGFGTF
jgi:hypothetical protein